MKRWSSEEEQEAIVFALALLMPKDEYRKVMLQNTENGKVYTDRIAKHFNVTRGQAILRGQLLGFLEW